MNVYWHDGQITRPRGVTLWLTGLSSSGKSTLARALEAELFRRRRNVYVLDGDNLRHGLNRDLAFSPTDRAENIRRAGEVAKLFTDFGAIVVTAFISPYATDRNNVRALLGTGEFVEVLVDAPLETCEARDPKGLYARARRGEIPEFTGVSAPYEPPEVPELVVDTARHSVEQCVAQLLQYLEKHGHIEARSSLIAPYGGRLVDRRAKTTAAVQALPQIRIDSHTLSDLYLIAVGALSPLTGFMGRADYEWVLERMTLANGLPWSVPITLAITQKLAGSIRPGDEVALIAPDGETAAFLHVEELFTWDREREASLVYGTKDRAHPGVARLHKLGAVLVGGAIEYVYEGDVSGFAELNLTPAETRAEFERRGWKTVVGFQTRNPVHRAHEYLQKCALESADGLLLHPLVGDTKSDDVPAPLRVDSYRVLIDEYYPKHRVLLSVLPAAMRYAGPREAIFHAIIRRNYGCSHFIVGRDHAGVGNYYGTYAAQEIFDTIDLERLGITPLKFEHAVFCTRCQQMVTPKTCPHNSGRHVFLSGTQVRSLLSLREPLPTEFTRPEVAQVLTAAYPQQAAHVLAR
jgi:sulfate adenylyltransferase/3'-phosphoadenosine 5'-phosphosulfate synthase